MIRKIAVLVSITLFLIVGGGCSGGSSNGSDSNIEPGDGGPIGSGGPDKAHDLSFEGVVQKGPFIQGSEIILQELNEDLLATGVSYRVETNDDFGSFIFAGRVNSPYVEVVAKGYYFNEVSGELSESQLTLSAIFETTVSPQTVNVNILTTLAFDRIKYLINNEGVAYNSAREMAQEQVLNQFSVDPASLDIELEPFSRMDLSHANVSDAILMAVSVILQADNTVAELSELISKISADIGIDGSLDDEKYIAEIIENSIALDISAIRENLSNRYLDLGLTVTVPDFSQFVDSNGNGSINMYSTADVSMSLFPSFLPMVEGDAFGNDILVSLGCQTVSSQIYYTLDGSDPTPESKIYTDAILIEGDLTHVTLKAYASTEGKADSSVISKDFSIRHQQLQAPLFSAASGDYVDDIAVSIRYPFGYPMDAEAAWQSFYDSPLVTIYYTVDGSEPDFTSAVYDGEEITTSGTGTSLQIKTFAVREGYKASDISSGYFIISGEYPQTPIPLTNATDFEQKIIGEWVGTSDSPWVDPVSIEMTFYPDGTYAATTISTGTVNPAYSASLYHNRDGYDARQTYEFSSLRDDGCADGIMNTLHGVAELLQSGTFRQLCFSNNTNNIVFEFWHKDQYGPSIVSLTRK